MVNVEFVLDELVVADEIFVNPNCANFKTSSGVIGRAPALPPKPPVEFTLISIARV